MSLSSGDSNDGDASGILNADANGVATTAKFLAAIAPEGGVTFQTLRTNKALSGSKNAWRLNKTLHGTFVEHAGTLQKMNNAGACIFFMVNRGDGASRSTASVLETRAVFVDLDGAPLEPVLECVVPPSITVESSPGRFHAYWLVRNMPCRDFKEAQQQLAQAFHGDMSICDLPRLMRLPGFVHRKNGEGAVAKLLSCFPDRIWDWTDLSTKLGLTHSMSLPEQIPEGQRNTTLFNLAVAGNRTGIPKQERLRSLLTLNQRRCAPPLPEQEVKDIVNRAYKVAAAGNLVVPLSLLTDDRFVALGWGEKLLLILSHQRVLGRPDAEFALPWQDFKHHFPRERTFGDYRKRIVDAGFLRITKRPIKPKDGRRAQAGLYKFN